MESSCVTFTLLLLTFTSCITIVIIKTKKLTLAQSDQLNYRLH